MLNVIFIFPQKYLPDRRLLPQFAKANNKIVKAIKKITLMFSKNIMRYSNVDFKKGLKMVVMVVSSMLTIYISVNSYDNQPYFPLSLVVILSFL